MIHKKITTGFVIQNYDGEKCVGQEFIAGDQVDYETPDGESLVLGIDVDEGNYQPFDMVQPIEEIDYYVIWMWKCIEPQLYGPYQTPDKQQTEIDRLRTEHGEDDHSFFVMNITKGAVVKF